MTAIDTSISVGIGSGLVVFGDIASTMRAADLFLRRDRSGDAMLPQNTRSEDERADLGVVTMGLGRDADGTPLVVTGNMDAMTRIQALFLADRRRAS